VASACLLGLPAERLLYGDEVERLYWSTVLDAVIEQHATLRDNSATAIANAMGELLRRMFRRRPGRG
jgi:hypothetical protein